MGTILLQSVLLSGPLNSATAVVASIFSDAAMGTTETLASLSGPAAHLAERAWGGGTQWELGF